VLINTLGQFKCTAKFEANSTGQDLMPLPHFW